jgi:hypothetical protein
MRQHQSRIVLSYRESQPAFDATFGVLGPLYNTKTCHFPKRLLWSRIEAKITAGCQTRQQDLDRLITQVVDSPRTITQGKETDSVDGSGMTAPFLGILQCTTIFSVHYRYKYLQSLLLRKLKVSSFALYASPLVNSSSS